MVVLDIHTKYHLLFTKAGIHLLMIYVLRLKCLSWWTYSQHQNEEKT